MSSFTTIVKAFFKDPMWVGSQKPAWQPEKDMKSLSGKVVVLTGPNSGIGYETLRQLVLSDAKVYMLGRNMQKMQEARQMIQKECQSTLDQVVKESDLRYGGKLGEMNLIQCDLSSLQSVKKATQEILAKEEVVDLVFANAGVFTCGKTVEGYELMFGTNTLGHHALIRLLLPAIKKSAQRNQKNDKIGETRLIFTSSGAHAWVDHPNHLSSEGLSDVKKASMSQMHLYGRSKMGNILTAKAFSKLFQQSGDDVVVCSVHPGGIQSNLGSGNWLVNKLKNMMLHPAPLGAVTQLWAGVGADKQTVNDKYLVPWARVGETNDLAQNPKVRDTVWQWCEQQCLKHGLIDEIIE